MIGTLTLKNIDTEKNLCDLGIFIWEMGKGYGPAALEAIKSEVLKFGISRIQLGVYPDNEIAIKAYRKSGFVDYMLYMIADLKQ
jgi:RimJ/RimL family protein N-acetyltransferase